MSLIRDVSPRRLACHLMFLMLTIAAGMLPGQSRSMQPETADLGLLRKFDRNGDGKIDDEERRAVREMMRQRNNQPGARTPSGKTERVGNRLVTELQYPSCDGRQIPCVLSAPEGEGPYPVLVTIHGGLGDRDLGYLRTLAAPTEMSPTVKAFNQQPWLILAISYRSGNGALFGLEQDDVIAGIRFAKTLPQADARRVGVFGGSHGGHLALVAAERMGAEFLCVAAGSPWMTDPLVYMMGDPTHPPLAQVPAPAREDLVRNGRKLFANLQRGRGLTEAEARNFLARHSIEGASDKIRIPTLFLTSRGDDQAPHVLIEPMIERMRRAGQAVEVYTAEKSPHGFYWARTVSAARALRGEKSAEESDEEETARRKLLEFFTRQFTRTDLEDASPAEPNGDSAGAGETADSKGDTATPADGAGRRDQPEQRDHADTRPRDKGRGRDGGGRGRAAGRSAAAGGVSFEALAGSEGVITREAFQRRFNQGGKMADRPELANRLFDRLDSNGNGSLDRREFDSLKEVQGRLRRDSREPVVERGQKQGERSDTTADPRSREDLRQRISPSQRDSVRILREKTAKAEVPPELERRTIAVGQAEREFFIHVPEKVRGRPAPVIFVLHGGAASSGLAMHWKTDFTRLGSREGYVTVYPSGINGWNIGSHDLYSVRRRTSDADDVGFFREMFDLLIKERIADPARIHVVGGSNGGVMTMHLVCHLADRIAGAGVLVATLPRAVTTSWPRPQRAVPIVIMLGTEDPMKPWEGNRDQMSAEETVAYWRGINSCRKESVSLELPDLDPRDGCRVQVRRWEGTAPVAWYTLQGHGHGWPMQRGRDDTGTGPKTRDISAPDEFWQFFNGAPALSPK